MPVAILWKPTRSSVAVAWWAVSQARKAAGVGKKWGGRGVVMEPPEGEGRVAVRGRRREGGGGVVEVRRSEVGSEETVVMESC